MCIFCTLLKKYTDKRGYLSLLMQELGNFDCLEL